MLIKALERPFAKKSWHKEFTFWGRNDDDPESLDDYLYTFQTREAAEEAYPKVHGATAIKEESYWY